MKVLVVEDDTKIRASLVTNLKAENYTVDQASDGDEGLRLARSGHYDVIVLDFMLPYRDGLDVCAQLRTEGVASHIIGLSVKSDTVNKVQFLDAGADDYLTKPFSFIELAARIRALLRRAPLTESDILTASDITLDCKKHKVFRGEKEVYLTRKEFSLLEYMLRNRGTVLSRGMILEKVWDMNADPFSNTIETHIMTLRKKLQLDRKNDLIATIPGVGYRID